MSFVHALKWSFLAEMASKAVTPIVFIVLARLLTPEDFGVMTAAAMVIAFSQIFWEAGMGKALIQRQTDVEDAANVAFWVNIALGILIASFLLWGAEPIAVSFFQDQRVTAVLQVMTLAVLIGALSSVQTALIQKEMGFKKLFWVRLMTVALPGMASIPLAWYGLGYWALVAGTLTGQVVQLAILWRLNNWRPDLRFNTHVARSMTRFGVWVGATGVLNWLSAWADSLIVGQVLGLSVLGLYRAGYQFSNIVFILLFSSLLPVLYSYLSRIQLNQDRLRVVVENSVSLVTWLCFPIGIFFFVFSADFEDILFGAEWTGLSVVIALLSLRQSFAWISSLNGEAYRAIGKPKYETYVEIISLFICLPIYWITAHIDLTAFLYGRLGLVVFTTLMHMSLLANILKLSLHAIVMRVAYSGVTCFFIIEISKATAIFLTEISLLQIILSALVTVPLLTFAFYLIEKQKVVKFLVENMPAGWCIPLLK